MDNPVTFNLNLTDNATQAVHTLTLSLENAGEVTRQLTSGFGQVDEAAEKAAQNAQKWTQLSDVLATASSLIAKLTPSPDTAEKATATSLATQNAASDMAGMDMALILNASAAQTWQDTVQETFSGMSRSVQEFATTGLSVLSVGLQTAEMVAKIGSAYSTLKTLNLVEWITQTQLYTTAQTIANGAIEAARRSMYVYQMQVITARAAISSTTGATKLLNIAMAASPWMLAIAGVTALCTGLYALATRSDEAAEANKRLNGALEEMEKNTATEQLTLDRLFGALEGVTEGSKEWLKIRDNINEKYGDYLQQMKIEIKTTQDARTAYEQLSIAIRNTARERAMEKVMGDAGAAYAEKEAENLTEIREAMIKKFGEKEGTTAFVKIRDAARRGGELPEELKSIVSAFDYINRVDGGMFADTASSKSNTVEYKLSAISKSRAEYDKEIKKVYEIMGVEEAAENSAGENTGTGTNTTETNTATGFATTPSNPIGNAIKNIAGITDNSNPAGGMKNITVNIDKLIDKFEISTTNLREDAGRIRQLVAEALTDAVNDLNVAL